MSNIIPPLLSDTPPPPPDNDEHEDDEFGDFNGTNNLSYDYDDSVSPPGSPLQLPTEQYELDDPLPSEIYDINSNSKENVIADSSQLDRSKDFCDKRKDLDSDEAESHIASDFFSESVLSKITKTSVDDKSHTALNVTAPASIFENHNLLDENQEHIELKNNKKLNEIIGTNCDIKTTPIQQETEDKGCTDIMGVLPKTDCKLESEVTGTSNTDISNVADNIIATSSTNTTVNYMSNTGANSIHNSLELSLDNAIIDNELSERLETISNKTSSIVDNFDMVKHLEDTLNSQNMKTIMAESTTNSQLSNTIEKRTEIDEFSLPQDREASNIERVAETSNKIGYQQNYLSSRVCDEEVTPKQPNLEINSKDLSRFPNNRDQDDYESAVISEESIVYNACLDDNEFGAFISNSVNVQNCSVENTDDFGDFAIIEAEQFANSSNVDCEKQKFYDFASFPLISQHSNQAEFSDEDDFGEFATTVASQQSLSQEQGHYDKVLLLSEKQALEKSHIIIKEMFPPPEFSVPDFEFKGLEESDKIFNQIKNITDTHALSFQWSKSASQNLLLMSLNIDSRNILHGSSWNTSVPRFAANLTLTPLEPVKSEILTPTPVKETNSSNASYTTTTTSVDALHFDLVELGFKDPMDYSSQPMLLDLEQLVAKLEISSVKSTSVSHNSSSPANEFENWEAWLQSIPDKEQNSSVNLTSDTTNTAPKESMSVTLERTITSDDVSSLHASKEENFVSTSKHDDFDSFVSYSTTSVNETPHGHNIILRETHISNKEPSKTYEQDIVNWLEPTIVTPELSRKERSFVEADDEFDDFQMVVMPEDHGTKSVESSTNMSVKSLDVLQPQAVSNSDNNPIHASVYLSLDEENAEDNKNPKKRSKTIKAEESSLGEPTVDDDFGDFTFSLPAETKVLQSTYIAQPTPASTSNTFHTPLMNSVHSSPPAPLLEPLKPSVVQLQNASSISWPAPGITDEEISRFEALGYSRVQHGLKEKNITESNVAQRAPVEQSTRQEHQRRRSSESSISPKSHRITKSTKSEHISKQSSLEDEEWSDFVSVQTPSPVHKLRTEKERSSTPDLPLSVLNLGSIQPTKQPIPVITPNGLVQTRLSSNMTLNFPNMMQQTNRVYSQPQAQNNPLYQPSIISNQFATQAYAGFNNYTSYQPHMTAGPKTNADDDEWSDFVSHQSTMQKPSEPKSSQYWPTQQNRSSTWLSTAPNIITNPAAGLDVLSGSSIQQQTNKKFDSVQNRKGNGVPCVSVPELDFLAPRNRTIQRK